ncbi:TOBE domain-containing protein [Desulfovibrio inopinatus]|uniref:TOBE domain-containing protein n=1 Tax=Desulfovibrio inopinatus TaxID=102109 RepID=UPI0003FA8CCE|nr:TOBE domain-containing protein [Desulfovibrio inopinatus]
MYDFDSMDDEALASLLAHAETEARRRLAVAKGPTPLAGRIPRFPRNLCPAMNFQVSDDVKHLDTVQLDRLTQVMRDWTAAADRPETVRSRGRVLFIYLLLRYTGAKLGEVLSLSWPQCYDPDEPAIVFSTEGVSRRVPITRDLAVELASSLHSPAFLGLLPEPFRLDPAFVRRKLQEAAVPSGFCKDMVSPRIIRHSRAVELFRAGLPLAAVQAVIGLGSAEMTASYMGVSAQNAEKLLAYSLQGNHTMITSARNAFRGKICVIESGPIVSRIDVITAEELSVSTMITNTSLSVLGLVIGTEITVLIKAPQVVVRPAAPDEGHESNAFFGTITSREECEMFVEIQGKLDRGPGICALVGRDEDLQYGFAQGDRVVFSFSSFASILSSP